MDVDPADAVMYELFRCGILKDCSKICRQHLGKGI